MSIDTIKQELARLDSPRRNQLVAYLISLNDQESDSYRAQLAAKIDDTNPRIGPPSRILIDVSPSQNSDQNG